MSEAIELAKKFGLLPEGELPKYPTERVVDYPDLAEELEAFYTAVLELGIQRGRELEREEYKLLFFIDPAALPLSREAEMIYATVSAFDWCTVPVYVNTPVPAIRVEQPPVEPEEVYSPHTKVLI